MLLTWFDATEAKLFGVSLADFYLERVKTDTANKSSKFVEKKQRELLGKMQQQILVFKLKNKLNFYKKAQLGNAFKWRLIDSALERKYVEELTTWLTRNL